MRRNIERFPEDFMFELTAEEALNLRSQIATSSHGGARYLPFAFTEHGVLMLSNVLPSERAVLMSIHIIRVFTRMRELLLTHKDLLLELEKLRSTSKTHAGKIAVIFKYPMAPRSVSFRRRSVPQVLIEALRRALSRWNSANRRPNCWTRSAASPDRWWGTNMGVPRQRTTDHLKA